MWKWFKKIFIGEFNKIEDKVSDQITDSVTQVKEQLDKSIDKFIDNMKSDEVKGNRRSLRVQMAERLYILVI